MSTTQRLARGQQLLLQRLLASHAMVDADARKIFMELEEEMDGRCDTLESCFGQINAQLTKGFAMEIVTINLSVGGRSPVKYHSIVNKNADDVAKNSFESEYNKHELALIRLIVGLLVEKGPSPRKDLINCRAELKEPYKMSLDGAEHCVGALLSQGWLIMSENEENRRTSMQATIEIGPRTYLELAPMLTDLGMDQDELPQTLFHS